MRPRLSHVRARHRRRRSCCSPLYHCHRALQRTASLVISRYDYLIIAVYLVFLASMGWIFRRFNHGSKDYFAGGFRMTWWLLGANHA